MFTAKKSQTHKHTMRRAYKYDRATNTSYNLGPRWLLMWACTTCTYRYAYDLTHKKPGG